MKKTLILGLALLTISALSGQIEMSNGKIGIGTATPQAAVHLQGDGLIVSNRQNEAQMVIMNGNVGIGTSAPTANLEVHGRLKLPHYGRGSHYRHSYNDEHFLYVGTDGYVYTKKISWAYANGVNEETNEKSNRVKKLQDRISILEEKVEGLLNKLSILEGIESVILTDDLSDASLLNQSHPNPTANEAVINYKVTTDFQRATLRFYNISGQIIKEEELRESGAGQLRVDVSDLPNGSYMYSLIVDGRLIDTKTMIVSK